MPDRSQSAKQRRRCRVLFDMVVRKIQCHAVDRGLDKMTEEEIEAEIASARKVAGDG